MGELLENEFYVSIDGALPKGSHKRSEMKMDEEVDFAVEKKQKKKKQLGTQTTSYADGTMWSLAHSNNCKSIVQVTVYRVKVSIHLK